MKLNQITIPATDLARSVEFYTRLGLDSRLSGKGWLDHHRCLPRAQKAVVAWKTTYTKPHRIWEVDLEELTHRFEIEIDQETTTVAIDPQLKVLSHWTLSRGPVPHS